MNNIKAFSLIELIVIITILAILGTIAFFSFQGYSKSSRDSIRITDLAKIRDALEIFSIDSGKYPLPNDKKSITYSGGIIWEQGSFGDSTFKNVKNLNKIPTDPLVNSEYTYSITLNRNQFQLGGIYENSDYANINLINKSLAGDIKINALIVGNYNGLAARAINGSDCYVLNVPSIITNDTEISTDYIDIVNDKKLVFDGYENIPSTYKNSRFNLNGGFDYSPNNLIIYNDNNKCKELETNEVLRIDYLKYIQESYSGTILTEKSTYSNLLGLNINEGTLNNEDSVKGLACNLWHVVLGKKVKSTYLSNFEESDGNTEGNIDIIEGSIELSTGEKIICPLCAS